MKLEFEKFDIENFNKNEDWESDCVFILDNGTFIEGFISCDDNEVWFVYRDVTCELYKFDLTEMHKPKYYMFKD